MEFRITAISPQKHNANRVNIHLDDEYAFSLSRIVAAWLQTGSLIDDEKIDRLKAEDELEKAYQRALNWISYRTRTEVEIKTRLEKLSIPPAFIQIVIERLKRNQLIDDEEFAVRWIQERNNNHPRSKKALAFELKQHGVDSEIIEDTIKSVDDSQQAYLSALKKARQLKDLEWFEYRQKMLRYLAGKGFSFGTSTEAAKRVWDEISLEKSNTIEGANV